MTERNKKLFWYIVYWTNPEFKGSKEYTPRKVGSIFGMYTPSQTYNGAKCRMGFNKKKKDFAPVEKYTLIMKATKEEFKEHMLEGGI